MEYVEFLRARGILRNYGIVLLVGLVLTVLSLFSAHLGGHVVVHVEGDHQGFVDLSTIAGISSIAAFVIVTFIGQGLSAESSTLAIVWTRPVPRSTIAWRFIAIDLATIAVSYLALVIVILICLATLGASETCVSMLPIPPEWQPWGSVAR